MPRSFLVKQQRTELEMILNKEETRSPSGRDPGLPPPLLLVRKETTLMAPPPLLQTITKIESLKSIDGRSPEREQNNNASNGESNVNSIECPSNVQVASLQGSTDATSSFTRVLMDNEPIKHMQADLRDFFYTDLRHHELPGYYLFNNVACPKISFPSNGHVMSMRSASSLLRSENEKMLSRAQVIENGYSALLSDSLHYLPSVYAHYPLGINTSVQQQTRVKSEHGPLVLGTKSEVKIEQEPNSVEMHEHEVEIRRVRVTDEESTTGKASEVPFTHFASSVDHPHHQAGLGGVQGRGKVTKKATPTRKYRYTCDVCGKSFSRSNTLTTHKRIHTGDKPFHCEQCGRAFRQPGNLTRHRLTHTTIKPYVCPQCNKAFNRASNLHTHMRTHTNYKPFVCDFCGKGFHQKIDMKIHRYTHTGEKPHKCSKCGRGFKQLTHLTYHMRTHSEERLYKCQYCGKGFNQKGNLQAHIYGHTGERPYRCDICNKGFTLASTLNTHKRTHASKKPFECQFCGKSFYQKNALKTHYIASHPFANGVSLL